MSGQLRRLTTAISRGNRQAKRRRFLSAAWPGYARGRSDSKQNSDASDPSVLRTSRAAPVQPDCYVTDTAKPFGAFSREANPVACETQS